MVVEESEGDETLAEVFGELAETRRTAEWVACGGAGGGGEATRGNEDSHDVSEVLLVFTVKLRMQIPR